MTTNQIELIEQNFISVDEILQSIRHKLCDLDQYVVGKILSIKKSRDNDTYLEIQSLLSSNKINAVIWNSSTNDLRLGHEIAFHAKVKVFGDGRLHITVIEYENLSLKEDSEKPPEKDPSIIAQENGIFKVSNIKPHNISSVGLITSSYGSVIKDMRYVLKNFKGVIHEEDCCMQGSKTTESVIKCLKKLDKMNLDVIIIARGGGSRGDLDAFYNLELCQEVYNTNTFVISAIGHETDFSLCDFAANYRAPTPSIAAQIILDAEEKIISKNEVNVSDKLDLIPTEVKKIIKDQLTDIDTAPGLYALFTNKKPEVGEHLDVVFEDKKYKIFVIEQK